MEALNNLFKINSLYSQFKYKQSVNNPTDSLRETKTLRIMKSLRKLKMVDILGD